MMFKKVALLFGFSLFFFLIPSVLSAGIVVSETYDQNVRRTITIETEQPYELGVNLSSLKRLSQNHYRIKGTFFVNDVSGNYTNSGNRYLGFANAPLSSGGIRYCNKDWENCIVLGPTDFNYLTSKTWKGQTYDHVYYTMFTNLPNGTYKNFILDVEFTERPGNRTVIYFGGGSSVIVVLEGASYISVDTGTDNGMNVTFMGTSGSKSDGGIGGWRPNWDSSTKYAQDASYNLIGIDAAGVSKLGWHDTTTGWARCDRGCDGKSLITVINTTDGSNWINYTFYAGQPVAFYEAYNSANSRVAFGLGGDGSVDAEVYESGDEQDLDSVYSVPSISVPSGYTWYGYAIDGKEYGAFITSTPELGAVWTGSDVNDYADSPNVDFMITSNSNGDVDAGTTWSGWFGFHNFTRHDTPPTGTNSPNIADAILRLNTTLSITDNLGSSGSGSWLTVNASLTDGSWDGYWTNASILYPEERKWEDVVVSVNGFTSGSDTTIYLLNSTSTSTIDNSTDFYVCLKNESGTWNAYSNAGCSASIGEVGVGFNGTTIYNNGTNVRLDAIYSYKNAFGSSNTIHPRITLSDPITDNPPVITIDSETPTDPENYTQGQTYYMNVTVDEDSGTSGIDTVIMEWDGVNYTALAYRDVDSDTREYTFNVTDLGVATYVYNWFANDTVNQWSNLTSTYTVSVANSSLSLDASPSWTETFPQETTVTGSETNAVDDDCTYNLYRDHVTVSDPETNSLGAGTHIYTWNNTVCTNISAGSAQATLTINKGSTAAPGLAINNSESDFTGTFPDVMNVTGWDDTYDVTLYNNGTSITNPSIEDFGAGDFNFTAIIDTENISSPQVELAASIAKESSEVSLQINNSRGDTDLPDSEINLTAAIVGEAGETVYIYLNGTLLGSGASPFNINTSLSIGYYLVKANWTGDANTSSDSESWNAAIQGINLTAFYDEETLAAIKVNITISNSTQTNTTYSNSTSWGNFSDEIPSGDVTITMSSDGYTDRSIDVTMPGVLVMDGYLLSTTSGSYIRFHVLTSVGGSAIEDALVNVEKEIGGVYRTIESKETDSSGVSRVFLDPLDTYRITITATGYATVEYSIQPTSSDYYIYMATTGGVSYTGIMDQNITFSLEPQERYLYWTQNRTTNATNGLNTIRFNITSFNSGLVYWGMNVTNLDNGTTLYNQSSTVAAGGTLAFTFNVTGLSQVRVIAYFRNTGYNEYDIIKDYTVYNVTAGNYTLAALFTSSDVSEIPAFAKMIIAVIITSVASIGIGLRFGMQGAGAIAIFILSIFAFYGWFEWWLLLLSGATVASVYLLTKVI